MFDKIMRSYDELKHVLRSYGEALNELPNYEKRYKADEKNRWLYIGYLEQLDLVHYHAEHIKNIAKEFANEDKLV